MGTVKDRVNKHGIGSLSDRELLALFMNTAGGKGPLERAGVLLGLGGNLSSIACAETPGTYRGEAHLSRCEQVMLLAAREIMKRSLLDTVSRKDALQTPRQVRDFLALQFTGLDHEVFGVLYLDNRNRAIEYRDLFRGTIDSAVVYPREVVKECLRYNAAAVIFVHNHPSGCCDPSDTDTRLTRKLTDALALIDVRVLDHVVCGQGEQASMAELGMM